MNSHAAANRVLARMIISAHNAAAFRVFSKPNGIPKPAEFQHCQAIATNAGTW